MTKPNFFILGAPKCGTTSLATWLRQHPNVFMPVAKEPHHFSVDYPLTTYQRKEDYLSLFEDARGDSISAVGEASVWYFRSREAVPRIEDDCPESKYIVMVRDPVEMAPSLHGQTLFNGDEDVLDFEAAWVLNDARERGESIPRRCRDPKLVQYRDACCLGEQLERLYNRVPRERVLVVFLEDVQADVRREWTRLLNFLELPYWDDLEFFPENRSKHWRWPWVRDLQRFYGETRRRFGLPPLGLGVFKRLNRVAVQEASRQPLSDAMRQELVRAFSDDIDRLCELTGRDLSHWKHIS